MKSITKAYLLLLALTLAFTASAGSAWANMASNTRIVNQATLTYAGGSVQASVTVTVALVPSAPTAIHTIPGLPASTSYNGPGTLLTNSFTVTATSNGPDTYNVTSATITDSTNTTNPTATPQAPASVALGATVTLSGSSLTVLNVPADGTNNGNVNGIQIGSTVVIGIDTRTVQSITDNATGTSAITLTAPLSVAPAAGVLVAEQKTVLVDVTSGTITTPGTNITVTKNITLASVADPTKTVTSDNITDTYTSGLATLAKYVRVVKASPPAGTGSPYAYNSNNYYQAGITAAPSETLEYILVATNSGPGSVSAAAITDALPTTYVTLVPNAYAANREITYVNELGTPTTYSAASDTDQASYATGTITVNVGTGATSAAGGSIPASTFVLVLYQVTVN